MTNTGKFIKNSFPNLYDFITIKLLKSRIQDVYYIMDSLGGFKEFFFKNEMLPIVDNLKRGLDQKSIKTIDTIILRMQNYADKSYIQNITLKDNDIIGGLLDEERINFDALNIKHKLKLKLNSKSIHSSAFYFYHGLSLLPSKASKHLEGKSSLDLGAYTGDSVIALEDFNCRTIYSIEMSPSTIVEYKENMRNNKISDDKYRIINCAVSNKDSVIKIKDSASIGLSLTKQQTTSEKGSVEIPQKTIDTIVAENNINDLAFIKADLEGYALESLQGGINSIRKQRPVLSIAIYHNPKEFFEVKPYLESKLKDYTYLIRRLATAKEYGACHAETVLLAYPNELR